MTTGKTVQEDTFWSTFLNATILLRTTLDDTWGCIAYIQKKVPVKRGYCLYNWRRRSYDHAKKFIFISLHLETFQVPCCFEMSFCFACTRMIHFLALKFNIWNVTILRLLFMWRFPLKKEMRIWHPTSHSPLLMGESIRLQNMITGRFTRESW